VAWDDPTRERVRESMKGIYDLFLRRVSEGRKTTVEKIAVSAEGRIFSGVEGKKRGLVDTLGGLAAAIARAKELGGLPADGLVRVFPSTPRLVDVLTGGEGVESEAPPVDPSKIVTQPLSSWLHETAPEIEPFAGSLAPLAGRDRVVCALPFALVVR
jgi:protease-4